MRLWQCLTIERPNDLNAACYSGWTFLLRLSITSYHFPEVSVISTIILPFYVNINKYQAGSSSDYLTPLR